MIIEACKSPLDRRKSDYSRAESLDSVAFAVILSLDFRAFDHEERFPQIVNSALFECCGNDHIRSFGNTTLIVTASGLIPSVLAEIFWRSMLGGPFIWDF